jgi:hypothetical protein
MFGVKFWGMQWISFWRRTSRSLQLQTMASATTTLTWCPCQWQSSSSSPRLPGRITCKASETHSQLSVSTRVDKTIFQIKNSGVIACLRANRSHLNLSSLFVYFGFLFSWRTFWTRLFLFGNLLYLSIFGIWDRKILEEVEFHYLLYSIWCLTL